MDVGILYSDLSKVWKPLDDIADFKKDGVLTIVLTTDRGNDRAVAARMFSRQNNDLVAKSNLAWWGEDYYAIGVMPDKRFFTTQWADLDDQLFARSTVDGLLANKIPFPRPWPVGAVVTTFIGAYLSPPEWEKALEIFKTELF